MIYDLIVVGGGAAGFFAAIQLAEMRPGSSILILEKSNRVLQKVKVSGGGRCNVTNRLSKPQELIPNYPRGKDFLSPAFKTFGTKQTREWFSERGVKLKIENDGRVFPQSDSSQTIIDCFLERCRHFDINVKTSCEALGFEFSENYWQVRTKEGWLTSKHLLIATGNSPAFWQLLTDKNIRVAAGVPSLFTFNFQDKNITKLSGLSVPTAKISIDQTNFAQKGPVLITHWGVSGPAVLRLSADAALYLHQNNYRFDTKINWLGKAPDLVLADLKEYQKNHPKRKPSTAHPFDIPASLWKFITEKMTLGPFQNWAETGNKQLLQLTRYLTDDQYEVNGKSTFKEEFVTAGGVLLEDINTMTFEHSKHPGLFFAGEVLNVDAYTGGFNFQAAWTTGFLTANKISENLTR